MFLLRSKDVLLNVSSVAIPALCRAKRKALGRDKSLGVSLQVWILIQHPQHYLGDVLEM